MPALAGHYLVSSLVAVAMMREYGQLNQGIGLLTDNAARGLRAYLVDCANNVATSQIGCPVTVFGAATTCTLTTFGVTRKVSCINVKGGWYTDCAVGALAQRW